jgi:hypothetical protein
VVKSVSTIRVHGQGIVRILSREGKGLTTNPFSVTYLHVAASLRVLTTLSLIHSPGGKGQLTLHFTELTSTLSSF